jgi:hypothetical protein
LGTNLERYGRDSIVLSDEEKRELREMAASEKLREEFRTLQRNSRMMEGRVSVDELVHWLMVMNRGRGRCSIGSLHRFDRPVCGEWWFPRFSECWSQQPSNAQLSRLC